MSESFTNQPQRAKDARLERTQYVLKDPVIRDGLYIYEIEPACPSEHVKGLAAELFKRFGGLDEFGFMQKVAVRQDGSSEGFADLGFKTSTDSKLREEVVAYVRNNI